MPRNTKASKASDGAASSSAAGDEEKTMDENRKKLGKEEKEKQREQKLAFSKNMYAIAMAYLEEHLEHIKTEGRGDCWLLTIMAGFEVTDPDLVAKLDDNQREEICTKRRPGNNNNYNYKESAQGARSLRPRAVTGPVLAASSTSEMLCRSQWSR